MPTVLIVEDEPILRDLIREGLEDAGFAVVEAQHADAAVAVLEARLDIRLVFTDVDMPGAMDGAKLAVAIRDRWPPIHLIVTSGKTRPPGLPAGAVFIPKPYRGSEVVATMRAFAGME